MADLTCIIVAWENFNDIETSILIPFQRIFYDEDIGDIWKDSKKSIYGEACESLLQIATINRASW